MRHAHGLLRSQHGHAASTYVFEGSSLLWMRGWPPSAVFGFIIAIVWGSRRSLVSACSQSWACLGPDCSYQGNLEEATGWTDWETIAAWRELRLTEAALLFIPGGTSCSFWASSACASAPRASNARVTATYTHHDKLIALSVSPYYVSRRQQ